jgi:hypothetical protein
MGHPIAFLSQFFQLLLFGPRKTSDKRTLSGNEVSVIVSEPEPPLSPCRQRLRPPRPALPRPSLPPNRRRHPPHPLRQAPDERVPVESLILGGHRQLDVLLGGVRDGGVFIPG